MVYWKKIQKWWNLWVTDTLWLCPTWCGSSRLTLLLRIPWMSWPTLHCHIYDLLKSQVVFGTLVFMGRSKPLLLVDINNWMLQPSHKEPRFVTLHCLRRKWALLKSIDLMLDHSTSALCADPGGSSVLSQHRPVLPREDTLKFTACFMHCVNTLACTHALWGNT